MRRKFAMLLVGATVAALAMAGAAVAQTAASVIQCNGGPPKTCKGTPAKDTITGSGRADNIFALCSPDSVDGNRGDDLVKGGKGYDLPGKGGGLEGGPGDDKVMGQRGDYTVQVQVEHGRWSNLLPPNASCYAVNIPDIRGIARTEETYNFRESIKGQLGFVGGYHAQDSQTLKSVSIMRCGTRRTA
jgi:hemolysin type calcium-binding protein